MNESVRADRCIFTLLDQRGPGKTICPSEAARLMAGPQGDWRAVMEEIHESVDALLKAGDIRISWKGKKLDQRRGAYRIARR